jgi:hypothetical protein
MEKLIAFDLYRKNEKGGHQPALQQSKNTAGFSVCLVAEVEALLWNIESADNPKLVAGTALRDLMERSSHDG